MILSFCKFFIFMHNMYKPLFKLSFRNYKVDKLPILAINLLWFHFYSSTYPHFTHNHIYHQYFVIIVQSLSCVWLFATPCTAAHQAPLSFTISWSLLKLMSIELVMPPSHLILCCPLLLPQIPPSIRVFSNESTLHMRYM